MANMRRQLQSPRQCSIHCPSVGTWCYLLAVILLTALISCSSRSNAAKVTSVEETVTVAWVQYDTLKEGRQIIDFLRQEGLHAEPEREATLVFRILVPRSELHKAWQMLRTNQLVLTEKVFLIELEKASP